MKGGGWIWLAAILLCLVGLPAFVLLPHGRAAITGVDIVTLRHQGAQQPRQQQSNSWPTDGADPAGTRCREGFLFPRRVFWQWASDTGPTLTEMYNSEDRVYAVFSLKTTPKPHDVAAALVSASWSMEFMGVPELGFLSRTVTAYDIGRDAHAHTVTIATALPKELLAHPTDRALRVTITLQHPNMNMRFDQVPFCLQASPVQFKHLVACTELTAAAAAAVPEWVAYHALQGVEHFYLYINDQLDQVRQQLEPLVKAGVVTVIDWEWPPRFEGGFVFQQAEQNGCLMRQRGTSRWVLLTDVDEFIQSMVPGVTVAEFLHQHSVLDHVGALAVQSVYFGSNSNDTRQAGFTRDSSGLVLGKYRTREKCCEGQKLVANPRGMSYSSVHGITTGGQEHKLDPEKELRLCHVKPGRRSDTVDDGLWVHAGPVLQKLRGWGYDV